MKLNANAFGNALGSSLAEQFDSDHELNAVRARSTARANARSESFAKIEELPFTIPTLRAEDVAFPLLPSDIDGMRDIADDNIQGGGIEFDTLGQLEKDFEKDGGKTGFGFGSPTGQAPSKTMTSQQLRDEAKKLRGYANLLHRSSELYESSLPSAANEYRQFALESEIAAKAYDRSADAQLKAEQAAMPEAPVRPAQNPYGPNWSYMGQNASGISNTDWRTQPHTVIQFAYHAPISPGVAVGHNLTWSTENNMNLSVAPDVAVG